MQSNPDLIKLSPILYKNQSQFSATEHMKVLNLNLSSAMEEIQVDQQAAYRPKSANSRRSKQGVEHSANNAVKALTPQGKLSPYIELKLNRFTPT